MVVCSMNSLQVGNVSLFLEWNVIKVIFQMHGALGLVLL